MIDPDGKFETEEEARAYAKDKGIKTGWFRDNKIQQDNDGTWSINNKKEGHSTKNYGGETGVQTVATVFGKSSWHKRLYKATENFFGVKEEDLRGPDGYKAAAKIAAKEASIILNVLSFGEGAVALQGASKLNKLVTGFGMANDANGLISDVTGQDLINNLAGSQTADVTKLINVIGGLGQSIGTNTANALPNLKLNIGNIGDAKDAYELKEKYKK